MTSFSHHPASFRDPSGFIFLSEGTVFRQVNRSYAAEYDWLMQSGLYDSLVQKKLLIPHEVVEGAVASSGDSYKILQPLQLPFISYGYEWCFDQLKDAALLTLKIMRLAVDHGMILKDATPFNVQFYQGEPIFIDTLSFEKYDPSQPWIAYRQFCECFLFPLYLEHYLKIDIPKLLSVYLDGIPVDMTSRLLPVKSSFNMGVWLHVHLQNSVRSEQPSAKSRPVHFDKKKLLHLVDHLQSIIKKFTSTISSPSTWSNYYEETILSQEYLSEKEKLFRQLLERISFDAALDIGANDGYFSQILAEKKARVIAIDSDHRCINNLYQSVKKKGIFNIYPLCIDISNPSPGTGLNNKERLPFLERVAVQLVVALALIHHLVLTRNIPPDDIASMMYDLTSEWLIIEFVPLNDEKASQLVIHKKQFHQPYDRNSFESAFVPYFNIEYSETIVSTERILYLMKK